MATRKKQFAKRSSPVQKSDPFNGLHENVSSYQIVHMKLGHVILGIVITIPRNELPKFKANDNQLYKDLLGAINGRMSQILQTEQNRKQQKKSKSKSKNKSAKHQIFEGGDVKFSCILEPKRSQYCYVEELTDKSDPNPSFNDCTVSPLCLSVYAVSKDGNLPFSDELNKNDNTNNSKKKR